MQIVDIIIDLHFTNFHTTTASKAVAGGHSMTITRQRDRLRHEAVDHPDGADLGRPRHADGRAAAALLAPRRPRYRRHRYPQESASARRGPVGLLHARCCCHLGTTLYCGKVFYRVTEAALPTLRVVPNPRVAQFARVEAIGWTLPIDDTSFRIYVAGRVKTSGDIGRMRSRFNEKFCWGMTENAVEFEAGSFIREARRRRDRRNPDGEKPWSISRHRPLADIGLHHDGGDTARHIFPGRLSPRAAWPNGSPSFLLTVSIGIFNLCRLQRPRLRLPICALRHGDQDESRPKTG
jgi:hypothetical protein